MGVWGGQAMGESVGQGVGVGRRVILVFFGVWKPVEGEKRGGRVFRFSIFGSQVFVLVCVKMKGCPPDWRGAWR